MKLTEREKNMILIGLKNEGQRFADFADELEKDYDSLKASAVRDMVDERIKEFREVADEYKALFDKIAMYERGE